MKRRDFLGSAAAAATLGLQRYVSAQPTKRAAIVIGIDKAGDLPVLNAAASGALEMATWLRAEGFQVQEFVDSDGPISVGQIYAAVDPLVARGTVEQLLIYFAGHGFRIGIDERWMMSQAPRNPNEAISVVESVELARYCGVPNVIFISDACRSTAESIGANQSHGSLIFPTSASVAITGEIDRFFAALPGQSALELPVQDSVQRFKGIYTAAFLDAYRRPDRSMVTQVAGVDVVPNRSLKNYLVREVQKRAEAFSIRLTQQPDSIIESNAYIGRVQAADVTALPDAPVDRAFTITDVATFAVARSAVGSPSPSGAFPPALGPLAASSGFAATDSAVRAAVAGGPAIPTQFETQTGFVIHGTAVASVATSRREMSPELLERGGAGGPAILRLQRTPGTVLLQFADGTGTVLAALPEFIGSVVVAGGGVVDVSYLPSQNSFRWQGDPQAMQRLNLLRGAVAAAMQQGAFRFEGDTATRRTAAGQLADRIRMLKGLDPTLGLYAAYAYSDAGLLDRVRSVRDIMRGDLNVDLFDVALLAGGLRGARLDQVPQLFPSVPMLTQGWNLLRVRGVEPTAELTALRNYLRPSTWTTFTAEGVSLLRQRFA